MKLFKLLLLFFVFSFIFRTDLSFDQDLGRHIKLGEIIWQTKEVPKTNLFSYTNPDFPFINTHWGFEVFVYLFNQSLGIQPLLFLKVLIFLFSVWLIIKTVPKENKVLLLPISFVFLHVLRERLEFRPEIFSFLFTSLTLYILHKFQMSHDRRKYGTILFLPLIQLIWINTHIYFFIGFLLQAIFLLHLGYQQIRSHSSSGKLKLLAIIFALSVLVSLINPNGLSGLLYPLNVKANYGYTIVENQTMFLLENINFRDPNFLFVKTSLGIILISIIIVILNAVKNLKIKPRDPSLIAQDDRLKNILLALSGAVLALLNVRSFPYLVFLSLPAVLQNFGLIKRNIFFSFLSLVTCALLLLESYLYLNGDYYKYTTSSHTVDLSFTQSVKGGMDFILANNLPGPIYNNFDIGSYIIYRGYPKYKVFVDGRPEGYPASFFTDIYIPTQYDFEKFKKLEEKYKFKTIIFSHTDQTPWGKAFLGNVVKDESWKIVYIDDFMLVLTKDGQGIDLSKLSPNSYNFKNSLSYLRLGIFLVNNGFTDSGNPFIYKAKDILPLTNKFFW